MPPIKNQLHSNCNSRQLSELNLLISNQHQKTTETKTVQTNPQQKKPTKTSPLQDLSENLTEKINLYWLNPNAIRKHGKWTKWLYNFRFSGLICRSRPNFWHGNYFKKSVDRKYIAISTGKPKITWEIHLKATQLS